MLQSVCSAGVLSVPDVAKTSEQEELLLLVQAIDGKTISDHLEMKPKSCTLEEVQQSM